MIQRPRFWFFLSLTTMVVSIALIMFLRPLWGVDFTGGTLIEVSSPSKVDVSEAQPRIQELLNNEFSLSSTVQSTHDRSLLIRTSQVSTERHQKILERLTQAGLAQEELRFETIGPTIGQELKRKAILAVMISLIAMVLYLAYTFRRTTGLVAPWKFGVAASYALLHDILFVTGLFVILGKFLNVPLDSLFVSAMLAIAGYSVNDTIVIFSRLKDDWITARQRFTLGEMIDRAATVTLMRSLNTALATLLTLIALFLFGGSTIRWFILAMTAGILVGTYSSIFVAAPALYMLAGRKTR